MRKLLLTTLLVLLTIGTLNAQQLSRQHNFDDTADISNPIDLRASGVSYFKLVFYPASTGVTTCGVTVEQSADAVSWSDLIASTACTTNGATILTDGTDFPNYVRINPDTKTGAGRVYVRLLGWISNPEASGTLSGDVTSNMLNIATEATLADVVTAAEAIQVDAAAIEIATEATQTAVEALQAVIQVRASRCILVSAASTNATNCKNAAGNILGWRFFNTTTTIYYLRMYNLTTAPTCSSATGFIESIPVPPASAAGQVGGFVLSEPYEEAYSTGIAFCFTGGSSSTDNTNAATGVFGTILYN